MIADRYARLERLVDEEHDPDDGPYADLRAVVRAVRWWAVQEDGDGPAVATADDVDAALAGASWLRRLDRAYPALEGPATVQHWVATSRDPAGAGRPPAEGRMLGARVDVVGGKPHGLGPFTSTPVASGGPGMWRLWLDEHADSPVEFPRPWRTWQLRVRDGAALRTIRCAGDWAALLSDHGRIVGGRLVPDWAGLAREHDGVRVTLAGAVATEGLTFRVDGRDAVPVTWAVESTLWLRWAFADVEPVGR